MSAAGRGRPGRIRTSARMPRTSINATRVTASLALLTLVSAAVVPVALAPETRHDSPRAAVEAPTAGPREPAVGALWAAAPTDLIRSRQWHMSAMRVPKAWKWSRGRDALVAVLDTGVDTRHRDLTGQVVNGPDYTGHTRKPGGKFWGGHGTAMASIIAGHGNGPGSRAGIMGIAPQAKILSIRVTWENDDPLRRNSGQVNRNRDAVAKGIRYAVDNGADVINMSLGGGRAYYEGNSTEEAAIRYALGKGVVLIASAGNDGAAQNRKNFPAAYSGVIAVGALDRRMKVWKDTNRHSYVSVCAPGVEIISGAPDDRYVVGTGTSPSSAIVAGVAALIRARYPRLTPEEVRQALIQGAQKRSSNGTTGTGTTGTGAAGTTAGAKVCPGPLDAVRTIAAANKINRFSHGPGSVRKVPPATPPPLAESSDGGSNKLLVGILGGGGILLLAGLILGWRQRRRPEDGESTGLPLPERPRETVSAMAAGGPAMSGEHGDTKVAPTSLTPWQGVDPSDNSASMSQPGGASPPVNTPIWPPPPSSTPTLPPTPTPLVAPVPPQAPDPATANWATAEPAPTDWTAAEPSTADQSTGEPVAASWTTGDPGTADWTPGDPAAEWPSGDQAVAGPASVEPVEQEPFADWASGPAGDPSPQLSPFDDPGNGHYAAPGNGNGHLDPTSLRPFDTAQDASGIGPRTAPGGLGNGDRRSREAGTALPFEDFPLGFGSDPLGDDPLPTGSSAPVADTPLAEESWRTIREGRSDESPTAPLTPPESLDVPYSASQPDNASALDFDEDDLPTNTFPAIDTPQADEQEQAPRRPSSEEDDEYRPPWW